MARVLIAYATTEGHTAKIVGRMRNALAARGHDVEVAALGPEPTSIPGDVDAVIAGGSIHRRSHQAELVAFAKSHGVRLGELTSGLFTVCLAAADPTPESEVEIADIVARFQEETGWFPRHTAVFAGCLAWSQYDVFTRVLMRLVLRDQPAADLDTTHDHDYTDYEAVERFALEVADAAA